MTEEREKKTRERIRIVRERERGSSRVDQERKE